MKTASKVTTKAETVVAAPINKALAELIAADADYLVLESAAAYDAYEAFAAVLRGMLWTDADVVKNVCAYIKEFFGEEHAAAAQIRVNIINNARKVACGGKAGDKVVRGKGLPAMHDVVESVSSIRELKKAMAKAKPEALKDARGGDTSATAEDDDSDVQSKTGVVIPISSNIAPPDAFRAALRILELCRDVLRPSDHKLLTAITSCTELMSEYVDERYAEAGAEDTRKAA